MAISTIRPNATDFDTGTGMTLTGGASLSAVTSDNSDSSYGVHPAGGGSVGQVQFGDFTLGAGAIIKTVALRGRLANASAGSTTFEFTINLGSIVILAATDVTVNWTTPTTITLATVANPGTWAEVDVDAARAEIGGVVPSVDLRVYELYLDVTAVALPVASVTAPTGTVTTTTEPTVQWTNTLDADGGLQTAFQVKVFDTATFSAGGFSPDSSTPDVDSGIIASNATSWTPTQPLADDTYRAYVRVAQTVNGAYDWSAWAFSGFILTVARPATPTLTLTQDDGNGRVRIEVTHNTGTATTDALEIQRSVDNITFAPVRLLTDTAGITQGQDATVFDYEGSNNQLVYYRARALHNYTGATAASAWATGTARWGGRAWWLKSPTNPDLNLMVYPHSVAAYERHARQGVFQPVGATNAIVVSDTRAADTGTIVLRADTDDEAHAIDHLIDTGDTLLLQGVSGDHWTDRYVVLGDLNRARLADKSFVQGTLETLTWTTVDPPLGPVTAWPGALLPSMALLPSTTLLPSGAADVPDPPPPPSGGGFNPAVNRVPFGTVAAGGVVSPWNKTLTQLYGGTGNANVPTKAPATNDTYIANVPLQNGAGAWIPWLACDTSQYCIPFYIITAAMIAGSPHTKLAYSGVHCEADDVGGSTTRTGAGVGSPYTFPFKVPATYKTPLGSDSQFMFWDRDNLLGTGGEWWDLWSVVVDGSNVWQPDGSGFMQCTNFSHGIGEFIYSGKPPTTPQTYVSRGPGTPYMLGTNCYWEYLAGDFNHVGAMAFTFPAATVFDTLVACKTDGGGVDGVQPREGSLIFLKSTFPVTDLPGGPTGILQMTARQWQNYGMRIVDSSGTPKVYFEADVSVGLGANWGGILGATNLLLYIPPDELCYVDDTGVSATRETDLRIDAASAADPLGTLPVCIASYLANAVTTPVATVSTINTGELVVAHVSIRGNNVLYVSGMSGTNGLSGTWKRIHRSVEDAALGQNLISEIWMTRATSNVSGTVTATTTGANTANLDVARFTVNATIRRKSIPAMGSSASAPSQLRGTTTNSLTVQWVTTRSATLTAQAGQTGVNINQVSGSGGTILTSSLLTKPGGGDILQTPTFGGAVEWLATAYEVT